MFAIPHQKKTKWKILINMKQLDIAAFLYVMHSTAGFLVIGQEGWEMDCELCEICFGIQINLVTK
jgi:hypothetical protein